MRKTLILLALAGALASTGCDLSFAPDLSGLECALPGMSELGSPTCDSLAAGKGTPTNRPGGDFPL